MPGPYTPADNEIGPIIHQIALTIQAQIPSIAYVYEDMPDRAPMDNTVLIPLSKSKVLSDTNGKIKVKHIFGVRHVFRRKQYSSNVVSAYSYVLPWLKMLAAWPNQNLSGLAISVTTTDLMVTQVAESGQPMVALVVNFEVLTEFNADLT